MANSKTSELAAKRWAKALMELALESETPGAGCGISRNIFLTPVWASSKLPRIAQAAVFFP